MGAGGAVGCVCAAVLQQMWSRFKGTVSFLGLGFFSPYKPGPRLSLRQADGNSRNKTCPLSFPSSQPFSPTRALVEASQIGIPKNPTVLGTPGCLLLAEQTKLSGQRERVWSVPQDPAPAPGWALPTDHFNTCSDPVPTLAILSPFLIS